LQGTEDWLLECLNKCLHAEKTNQQTANFRPRQRGRLKAKAQANHGRKHTPKTEKEPKKNKKKKLKIKREIPSSHWDILILPFGPTHNVHGQKREQRQKSKPHAERSLRPQGGILPATSAPSSGFLHP